MSFIIIEIYAYFTKSLKNQENIYYVQSLRVLQYQGTILIIKSLNMEIDKNFSFLASINLKKFGLSESKKQIQSASTLEFRNTSLRPSLTQISFNQSFPSQTLITNVEMQCHSLSKFDTNIQNVQLEFSSLVNRGHYVQFVNLKSERYQNSIIFSGCSFTHCIKINLVLKNEFKKIYMRSNQKQFQENIEKLISQCIKDINIYGISINTNPSSILLTKLLNISQSFKKYNMLQQAIQTDLLVSLSLISARRFVQAAQILRKVSKFYVQKYNSSKSIIDYNRTQKSWIREIDQEALQTSLKSNFGSGRILEGSKFLQRAAKIQLLLAETISHPSLVMQKLEAYFRCNSYACGNTNPASLRPDSDLQDVAITIFPQIVNFFLKMLSDKLQPIRISALKSIQFFIQTLGCSIGITFLQIMRQVIATYPSNSTTELNSNRVPHGLLQLELVESKLIPDKADSTVSVIKNKILIDHYHHLLQTLLSLTLQINKRMVLSIFSEIVVPGLLSKSQSYQLKLYLLRFAEKAISISGADLNIEVSFLGLLLTFCEQKNLSKSFFNKNLANKNSPKVNNSMLKQQNNGISQNKHVIHNLVYFSHKILNQLKIKILPRYSGRKIQPLLDWINKTLTYLGQNQILSNSNSQHSLFVFTTILDLTLSIYSSSKYDYYKIHGSPIQTVMYFANMLVHNQQAGVPFDKVISTLSILLKYHAKMEEGFQLHKQIISRILQKSKQNNLSLKELQILINVLEITEQEGEIVLNWLDIYLGSIPHSTYDETYQVFNIMINKSMKKIQEYPNKIQILKKLVRTMLDQYTVKGKAHQQSKQTIIQSLISTKSHSILHLIKICLFDNIEPKPEKYYSKKKPKAPSKINKEIDHHFDSKSYKIDFQMFIQKISFAQLILTKISIEESSCKALTQQTFIQAFFEYIKCLSQAQNLKLKGKALSLMNHYLQIVAFTWKQQKFKIKPFLLIIKHVFSINKSLLHKLKESKLMYSVIYNIMNLFKNFEIQQQNNQKIQQSKIDKLNEQFEEYIKNQKQVSFLNIVSRDKGQRLINFLLIRQFLKIWPILGQSLYSPWENVRQIYILLILQIFKQGLSSNPQSSKKKVLQISKQLMVNLFASSEHTERQAALKIFGCLLGLRAFSDNKNNQISQTIALNLRYLKQFTDKIFELTYDWNQTNAQIAENLCEICMPQQARIAFNLRKKQHLRQKSSIQLESSYLSFNLGDQMNQRKGMSTYGINNLQSLLLKQSWLNQEDPVILEASYVPNITQELLLKILQFKSLIQKDIQMRTQVFVQKQSFLQQNQQPFYDMGEQKAQSTQAKQISQDQQLEFEDLGIIELDDEEWGDEQEKQQKAMQKLSIKKINKLSPSILNSSKPQRIRSKRFHQNQFDYRQKIIVDELQQNITNEKSNNNTLVFQEKNQLKKSLQPLQIFDIYSDHKDSLSKDKKQQKQIKKFQKSEQQYINNQKIQREDYQDHELKIFDIDKKQVQEYKIDNYVKETKKDNLNAQKQYQNNLTIRKEKELEKKIKKNPSTRKRKSSSGK